MWCGDDYLIVNCKLCMFGMNKRTEVMKENLELIILRIMVTFTRTVRKNGYISDKRVRWWKWFSDGFKRCAEYFVDLSQVKNTYMWWCDILRMTMSLLQNTCKRHPITHMWVGWGGVGDGVTSECEVVYVNCFSLVNSGPGVPFTNMD